MLPGPDTLIVMRGLLMGGRPEAVRTAAGVLTGLAIWAAAAVAGLSALLQASHAAYTGLKVVGALYLVTLGLRAMFSRGGGLPAEELEGDNRAIGEPAPAAYPTVDGGAAEQPEQPERQRPRGGILGTGYLPGLACDLLNPKVGVFFVTFLPGFVPHGAPVSVMTGLFGTTIVFETAIYFGVLVVLTDRIVGLLQSPAVRRRLDWATGIVLVGFGLRLAIES